MPARNPEEICSLFKQYMAEGDFDGMLSVYDPEVVFLNQAGELIKGKQELKQELNRFAAARARFDFNIAQVIQSDDIALMHHPVEYLRTSADIRVRNRGRRSPARRHVALAHWRSVYGRQTRTSRDCRYWKLNGMSRAKLTFCSFVLSASPRSLRNCCEPVPTITPTLTFLRILSLRPATMDGSKC
jgi:ketosteroid isomerase-like protein